jgi:hypothetical protein
MPLHFKREQHQRKHAMSDNKQHDEAIPVTNRINDISPSSDM